MSDSVGGQDMSSGAREARVPTAYYPKYHFAPRPLRTDPWINDPQGGVWDEGAGVFRAWVLYSPDYNSNIFLSSWLEYTSKDGVIWEQAGVRIPVDSYDGGGLWGGSVIIDKDNTAGFGAGAVIYLITSAHNNVNPIPPSNVSRWVAPKLGVNPKFKDYVLENPKGRPGDYVDPEGDFRDSRVFWDEDNKYWVMCISVSFGIAFYKSADTAKWKFLSYWVAPGRTAGKAGGVEAPNLYVMKADDGVRKWVLFYSDQTPPRETVSGIVGEWDGTHFRQDPSAEVFDLDYGWDIYAQTVFPMNGKGKLMLGWFGNWSYALGNPGTPMKGYKNYLTLPRKLRLRNVNGQYKIFSRPQKEADALFGSPSFHVENQQIGSGKPFLDLKSVKTGVAFKLSMVLSLPEGDCWPSNINLNVRTNGKAFTQLFLLQRKGRAEIYRGKSGRNPSQGIDGWNSPGVAPVDFSGKVSLDLYMDSASAEYFFGQGDPVVTMATFPLDDAFGVTLTASEDGCCLVEKLEIRPFVK